MTEMKNMIKLKSGITAHMVIKNEDQFVWYAIKSVLPHVDKFLITDTGSSDKTLPIISLIKSDKIKLEKVQIKSREEIVDIRRKQIKETTTEWILLVDGDEVWGEKQIKTLMNQMEKANEKIYGIVNKTRNVVGDIYHYQNENAGKYTIMGKTGHLTMRALRRENLEIGGLYPNESYMIDGQKLQDLEENLIFCDTWYLHATHLRRSSDNEASRNTIDRLKKFKLELGKEMKEEEIPQVLREKNIPPALYRPQEYRIHGGRKILARILGEAKKIKKALS